jgi:hypothetical protein
MMNAPATIGTLSVLRLPGLATQQNKSADHPIFAPAVDLCAECSP